MALGEMLTNAFTRRRGKKRGQDRNGFPIFESEMLRHAGSGISAFNEIRVVERTNIFNLSSVFPLSILNDVWDGDVEHTLDEYRVGPGGFVESAELGRYVPGYQVESGKGVRVDDTTEQARFGYYDENNGMWWRYDATQSDMLSVGIRRAGADIVDAPRSQWNIDRLDGRGPSGINLDNGFDGLIFQELIGWYGFLPLSWWVADNRPGLLPQTWPVHVSGSWDRTSMRNPNLPIRIENEGEAGDVYAAGRQFSVIGRFVPSSRVTASHTDGMVTLGTDWTPIISARRKAGANQYSFAVSSAPSQVAGDGEGALMLVVGGDLTGADFQCGAANCEGADTGVDFDEAATAISGGRGISTILPISATDQGGGGPPGTSSPTENRDFAFARRIPRDLPVTLVGKDITGNGLDVRGFLNIQEEH